MMEQNVALEIVTSLVANMDYHLLADAIFSFDGVKNLVDYTISYIPDPIVTTIEIIEPLVEAVKKDSIEITIIDWKF